MAKNKVNPVELEVGEYLSEVQYYKIVDLADNSVTVINERGFQLNVDRDIIAEGMYSASQYATERLVTRTEICEQLEQAGNQIFTVNFYKQVKINDVEKKLVTAIKSKTDIPLSEAEIIIALKKASKSLLEGEERTLIGYLSKVEAKVGRSTVIDLELPTDRDRIRQVDHRTINWLILKNVKYVVR
jgi:hypothetical protein